MHFSKKAPKFGFCGVSRGHIRTLIPGACLTGNLRRKPYFGAKNIKKTSESLKGCHGCHFEY